MPLLGASSRAGTTTGGWLTIRYWPSTCSASFDSACKLSRVCAFCACFRAFFSAVFAAFLSAPLAELVIAARAAIRSASERCAYQMSIVRISANRVIASRYAVGGRERRVACLRVGEAVVARRDREARRHALHVVLERPRQRLVEVVEVEHQCPLR